MKRSYLSGAEKRKQKKLKEDKKEMENQKLRQRMKSMLNRNPTEPNLSTYDAATMSTEFSAIPTSCSDITDLPAILSTESSATPMSCSDDIVGENLADPATWPLHKSAAFRLQAVKMGPVQVSVNGMKNSYGRGFTIANFQRTCHNGEKICRDWLVYSSSVDKVFCFPCSLFEGSENISLVRGYDNWQMLSMKLKAHEKGPLHIQKYTQWRQFEANIYNDSILDRQLKKQLNVEVRHWREVLKRILDVVMFLARNNLPFRGSCDTVGSRNNGVFLQMMELLAKYDSRTEQHLRRAQLGTNAHYLSHDMQNEYINILAQSVTTAIIARIQASHYYAILMDCTPDISHKEQLTIIMRYVHIDYDARTCSVAESFLEFVQVSDTTGDGLTETLLCSLRKHGISIDKCRGQGYDNGSNMRGRHKGVQARVRSMNAKAVFIPCMSHNWNLVVSDAAASSVESQTFFGVLQQLYNIFSASTHRWSILLSHVKGLTVKSLSETRWEARIDAVSAIYTQLGDFIEALDQVTAEAPDCVVVSEAKAIMNTIDSYFFVIQLTIWYSVLSRIECVSKAMQSPQVNIVDALQLIKAVKVFLLKYRENGWEEAKTKALKIAHELNIDIQFPNAKRIRKVRRMDDEVAADEPVNDPEKKCQIRFFNPLIDTCIMEVSERFSILSEIVDVYGFLFDLRSAASVAKLDESCHRLQMFTDDISAVELHAEIQLVADMMPTDMISTPFIVLQWLISQRLTGVFSNIFIALRLLLTLPVTVASGERSFSKLKIIKDYKRSQMSNERLSGLATLSIEKEIAEDINYDDVIDTLAAKKARRVKLT